MRHVYFSFHYADVWKANVVRNSGVVVRSAGFADRSLWEEAKAKSKGRLERLIQDGLNGTSVTVVLIGRETADRPWVEYEIEQSIERGNALMGLHLHSIPDMTKRTTRRGAVPLLLKRNEVPIHDWAGVREFADQVEEAWQSQKNPDVLDQFGRWVGGFFR